ncbi:helix-turn-helix domain-containing protein [Micromonospora sp. CPCC 205371]|nr:helix-turn-helix domain-containing protein [Micromonospora sp. CPCC 205371]
MAVKSSPTTLRRQLGAELRRLRADRTAADVAAELGWSESKLSRIETAHTGIRPKDLDRLLDVYELAQDARARIRALAGQARQRAWWEAYGDVLPNAYETYIGFEAEATSILVFEALLIPGLLQTDEYARAVFEADGRRHDGRRFDDVEIDQKVQVRMARQAVLTRQPPPDLVLIVDEGALRRQVGGPDVLRRQLNWLNEAGERTNITIRVLPFDAGAHSALGGPYTILRFSGGDQPLVYCEGRTGGVFRTRADEVEGYVVSFDGLRDAALTPRDSARYIASIANDITD